MKCLDLADTVLGYVHGGFCSIITWTFYIRNILHHQGPIVQMGKMELTSQISPNVMLTLVSPELTPEPALSVKNLLQKFPGNKVN